jgi:hypothetical protein
MKPSQYFAIFNNEGAVYMRGQITDIKDDSICRVEVFSWDPAKDNKHTSINLSGENVKYFDDVNDLNKATKHK